MAYQKTNATGYVKDNRTGIIINNNDGDYQRILASRAKDAESKSMKEDVENLKSSVGEIKAVLTEILKRLS